MNRWPEGRWKLLDARWYMVDGGWRMEKAAGNRRRLPDGAGLKNAHMISGWIPKGDCNYLRLSNAIICLNEC